MSFPGHLRRIRVAKGIRMEDLAKNCRLDISWLSRLENHPTQHTPRDITVLKLAEELGINPDIIFLHVGKVPLSMRNDVSDHCLYYMNRIEKIHSTDNVEKENLETDMFGHYIFGQRNTGKEQARDP
jgi:transcriptional regulator with XRE-family HTH domain